MRPAAATKTSLAERNAKRRRKRVKRQDRLARGDPFLRLLSFFAALFSRLLSVCLAGKTGCCAFAVPRQSPVHGRGWLGSGSVPAGAIVQNEPNFGQVPSVKCEVRNKANFARPQRRRRPGGRNVQNEPNFAGRPGPQGPIVRNEPNLGEVSSVKFQV